MVRMLCDAVARRALCVGHVNVLCMMAASATSSIALPSRT